MGRESFFSVGSALTQTRYFRLSARCLARSYFLVFISFLSLACGTIQDIKDTKGEVKQSNQNMLKLIEQGGGMHDRMDKLIAQGGGLGEKMDESIVGVKDSLEEVKKSNANMEKLISQGSGMHDRMDKLIAQGGGLGEKMDESIVGVKDSLEEVKKSNANMEKLISQGGGMHDRMDKLIAQGGELGEKMSESLDEVIKARLATEAMLEKVKEQEKSIIRDTLSSLAEVIKDHEEFENHYRIAAAKTVYRLLIEKDLEKKWYSGFVAANLEMCDKKSSEVYGRICKTKFVGKTGKRAAKFDGFKEKLKGFGEKLGGIPQMIVDHMVQSADGVSNLVPLTPLSTNVIWSLGLREDVIKKFHEFVVLDAKNPQTTKARDFLHFARATLLSSLEGMATDEEREKFLPTYKLEAFRFRKGLIETINELSGYRDSTSRSKLKKEVERLVEAIEYRDLTAEEDEILQEIKTLRSNDKLATR